MHSPNEAAASTAPGKRPDALLAFLAYSILAAAVLWPLPSAPAKLALPYPDTYVNVWSLAWVAHQALADPLHPFDSNAYHPHPRSLAYAESLLPQSLQAAPVIWLGGSPLLAYNLVLLLTFPLSGLGAYLLAREMSGSRAGAFMAGLAYSLCTYRYYHLVHLQAVSAQWFPFALLYLGRAIDAPRLRHFLALGFFSVLQALSSVYYAVFLGPTLLVALLYRFRAALQSRTLLRVTLTLALAAGLVAFALFPHRRIQADHRLARSRDAAIHWSARWSSYLDPGQYVALPHLVWLRARFAEVQPLYPGLGALLLGAVGAVSARRPGPARLACLLTGTSVLLSLGPELQLGPLLLPGPFEAMRTLPGVSGLRAPGRMGVVALLGLALLAAIGWSRLARSGRGWLWAAALVASLMAVESFPAGLHHNIRLAALPPPFAHWLAQAPRGPVLELPWNEDEESALYLYWSTAHWQPMVNGYASFQPPGNRGLGLIGAHFPRPYASRVLRENGVRYVVVHADRVKPAQRARLQAMEDLPEGVKLAVILGQDWVFSLDPLPGPETGTGG